MMTQVTYYLGTREIWVSGKAHNLGVLAHSSPRWCGLF